MKRTLIILVLLFGGCSASKQSDRPVEPPELIKLSPLPPFPQQSYMQSIKLDFMLHVLSDGTIGEAKLVRPSGVTAWDTAALASVRQWRFAAARREGEPTDIWIRQEVTVYLQNPEHIPLSELVVTSQHLADSLFEMLIAGASFEELARKNSIAESREHGGFLGTVDVNIYPSHIRDVVEDLKEGEVSRPQRIGETFVLFMRTRPEKSPVP